MRRKSKGISPLVAVIMLIAFTMIVAGILAGWATRFATEQRSMLEKCVRANVIIKRATFDSVNNNVTLMLYNAGSVPLTDFQTLISYINQTDELPATANLALTIQPNSFFETSINTTYKDIDYVEIRSVECQGAYDLIRGYNIAGL